jgi:hypothetical protein
MFAPAPLWGEKQRSGGRPAATGFMSTHPSPDSDATHPPKGRIATAVSFQGLVHYVATDTASARARARTYTRR